MTSTKFKTKSRFKLVLIVCLSTLMLLQSCLSYRSRCKSIEVSDTIRQYRIVHQPYFQKKVNGVGYFCMVIFSAAGAVLWRQHPYEWVTPADSSAIAMNTANQKNEKISTIAGAAGGLLLTGITLYIGGNNDKTEIKSNRNHEKWIRLYNQKHDSAFHLVQNPDGKVDGNIWVLPGSVEKTFKPKKYIDFENYRSAFSTSPELGRVILLTNPIASKQQLKEMISKFPNEKAIFDTKVELLCRSDSMSELNFLMKLYPNTNNDSRVEMKYAKLCNNYENLKDFMVKYKKSDYIDLAISKAMYNMSKVELEEISKIIWLPKAAVDLCNLGIIEYSTTYKEMALNLEKFHIPYFVISYNADISNLDSVKAIYSRLMDYSPKVKKNHIFNVASDLKEEYVRTKWQNESDLDDLLEEMRNDEFLIHEVSEAIFDSVAIKVAMKRYKTLFVGNSKHIANGPGKLYKSNGQISAGNFKNNKLEGKGKKQFRNGDLEEGFFVNDELHGNGKIIYKSGRIVIGNFSDGLLEGEGSITESNGNYQKGNFLNNKLDGNGEKKTDLYIYKGNFKEGKFSGSGVFEWLNSDGQKFSGEFSDGLRNGPGVLYTPDGFSISGRWILDCPVGEMTLSMYMSSLKDYSFIGNWTYSNCMLETKTTVSIKNEPSEKSVLKKIIEY